MKRFTPRGAPGFTMIELLAVLAIVLTLAAVLFPAIENARAKSLQTKSLQNVRSLGQALIQYEADRGHYPAGELVFDTPGSGGSTGNQVVRQRWTNALAPYMGSDERAITDAQGRTSSGTVDQVNTGDRDQTVFSKGFADPAAGGWEIGRNNSLGYNYQYLGDARERSASGPASPIVNGRQVVGFVNYPVTRAQIPRPDKTIAFGSSDGTGGFTPYRPPSTSLPAGTPGAAIGTDGLAQLGNDGFLLDPTFLPLRDMNNDGTIAENETAGAAGTRDPNSPRRDQGSRSVLSNRHNGGSTVVFVDGHAEWILREDAYRDKDTGAFSNALWNGYGRDNDANGNGVIEASEGERVIDANEAFAPGATALSTNGVNLAASTNGLGAPQLSVDFQGYGPGFDTVTIRGVEKGPTLPKVPPLEPPRGNARGNRSTNP